MPARKSDILRLLGQLEGPLAQEFRNAVATMTSRARIEELAFALNSGDLDSALKAAGIRAGSWNNVTEEVRRAYYEAGVFTMVADVPKRFGAEFDLSNPRAEAWLQQQSSQMVTRINSDQREAVRLLMQQGVSAGRNPRSIALDIVGRIGATGRRTGGVLGLNKQQAEYVQQMRGALSGADVGIFHTDDGRQVAKFWIGDDGKLKSVYSRRDRRFDPTIRKAIEAGKPLDTATVNRLTGRYSDRLLQLRGETIGRTEALAALNEAADESLRQIIDEGLAPPDAVKRIWKHSYSPNERPGHLQMSGQERGVNESFLNPLTGVTMMHPGDGPASEIINCRCMVSHKIDFVKVEFAA